MQVVTEIERDRMSLRMSLNENKEEVESKNISLDGHCSNAK